MRNNTWAAFSRTFTHGFTTPALIAAALIHVLPLPHPIASLCLFPLAIYLIFFTPGLHWTAIFSKKRDLHLSEFLFRSLGINMVLLACVTTAIKLTGAAVSWRNLLPSLLFIALVAELIKARKGISISIDNDLKAYAIPIIAGIATCIALFLCFRSYFTAPLDRYWLLDEGEGMRSGMIADWNFPKARIVSAGVAGSKGMKKIGERRYAIEGFPAALTYHNYSPAPKDFNLMFLFQAPEAAEVSISLNGKQIRNTELPKSIPLRTDYIIPRAHRYSILEWVALRPGENTLEIACAPSLKPGALILDELSGLDKISFASYMNTEYQLVRLGPMFDAVEAIDFASNLQDKLFTYTWDIRPGVAAYTIITPPLDFFTDSVMISITGGGFPHIKLLYLGKLFVVFLCAIVLCGLDNPKITTGLACMPAFAIAFQTAVLAGFKYVETVDTLLAIFYLLTFYFLWRERYGYFLLFSILASLTRFHGVLFPVLFMGTFLLAGRIAFSRVIRLLAAIAAALLIYAAIAYAIGRATGVLNIWYEDILWGHLVRFGRRIMEPCRTPFDIPLFTGWLLLASGFAPLFMLLKKDGLSKMLLYALLPYLLLVYCSTYVKVYYLVVPIYPLVIIAARNIGQSRDACLTLSLGGRSFRLFDVKTVAPRLFFWLSVASLAYLLIVPLTDPDYNSLTLALYRRLVERGLVAPYQGLY
jgi:hypothetical protein